jgi:hypothetical protein
MMRTRSAVKKNMMKVILQLLPSNEYWDVREADDYGKAMDFVFASHRVPQGWSVAVVQTTPQKIIVACQNGRIDTDAPTTLVKPKPTPTTPEVTPPQSKSRKAVLPDKLIGDGPGTDRVYCGGVMFSKVPGVDGETYQAHKIKDYRLRPAIPPEELVSVKMAITGEPEREASVRKDDAIIYEVLKGALVLEEIPDYDSFKLIQKPLKSLD